jgi:hypothetical protein
VIATNNSRNSSLNILQETSETLVTESESDENMGAQDIPN